MVIRYMPKSVGNKVYASLEPAFPFAKLRNIIKTTSPRQREVEGLSIKHSISATKNTYQDSRTLRWNDAG